MNPNDKEIATVRCGTTAGGEFSMSFYREWSPHGYDRAVELFERGFYDSSPFFRVVPDFLAQFGISYTTDKDLLEFAEETIPDDPQLDPPIPFDEGTISYAGSGPNSRDTHLFIAYEPYDAFGTELWETPIGEVTDGMETIRSLYSEYGDEPPDGEGPLQQQIYNEGRAYINREFPKLDHFLLCTVNRLSNLEGEEGRGDSQGDDVIEENEEGSEIDDDEILDLIDNEEEEEEGRDSQGDDVIEENEEGSEKDDDEILDQNDDVEEEEEGGDSLGDDVIEENEEGSEKDDEILGLENIEELDKKLIEEYDKRHYAKTFEKEFKDDDDILGAQNKKNKMKADNHAGLRDVMDKTRNMTLSKAPDTVTNPPVILGTIIITILGILLFLERRVGKVSNKTE